MEFILMACIFLQWMQQSIRNITDDVENCHLAYVTHEDICGCFKEDTMLAIQAPSGTELEVPLVEHVSLKFNPEIAL
jgi:transcription factor E2F4/5